MQRQNCPQCTQKLPFFLFTANRRIARNADATAFVCPNCNAKLIARSNEAHKKQFTWIWLTPLLATPMIFSLQGLVPSHLKPVYYFFGYFLSLMVPTWIGQHKMQFELASDAEIAEMLNNAARKSH